MDQTEDSLISRTDRVLVAQGYKLVEDVWDQFGRRTYLHDDDADKARIEELAGSLRVAGWQTNVSKLRSFVHPLHHELELEPGGADVTGHFLHHIKDVCS